MYFLDRQNRKACREKKNLASRKWVMSKKKKRSQAMSDSSDDGKLDENTTPLGAAARGRTHPGGNSKRTCTQRSVSTGHRSTAHRPFAHWTRRHHRPVTGHQSPVTALMGITHGSSSQSIIGHRPSSHRSLD